MYIETMTDAPFGKSIVRGIVMSGGIKGRCVLAGPSRHDLYANYSSAPKAPRDIHDLSPQEFYESLKAQQPSHR